MSEPYTTIFFGGPRDGELVPPELDDGRGTIDIPVRTTNVKFGDEPPIDGKRPYEIVTYKRHSVYVKGGDHGTVTRVDLWCPDNRYPGQYLHALSQHHYQMYISGIVQRAEAASKQRRISPIFGSGPHDEDLRDGQE